MKFILAVVAPAVAPRVAVGKRPLRVDAVRIVLAMRASRSKDRDFADGFSHLLRCVTKKVSKLARCAGSANPHPVAPLEGPAVSGRWFVAWRSFAALRAFAAARRQPRAVDGGGLCSTPLLIIILPVPRAVLGKVLFCLVMP